MDLWFKLSVIPGSNTVFNFSLSFYYFYIYLKICLHCYISANIYWKISLLTLWLKTISQLCIILLFCLLLNLLLLVLFISICVNPYLHSYNITYIVWLDSGNKRNICDHFVSIDWPLNHINRLEISFPCHGKNRFVIFPRCYFFFHIL